MEKKIHLDLKIFLNNFSVVPKSSSHFEICTLFEFWVCWTSPSSHWLLLYLPLLDCNQVSFRLLFEKWNRLSLLRVILSGYFQSFTHTGSLLKLLLSFCLSTASTPPIYYSHCPTRAQNKASLLSLLIPQFMPSSV